MKFKRVLSMILVVMMLVSLIPTAAFADDVVACEACNYNITFVEKAATCTEDGAATLQCGVCGGTTADVLAATGHSFEAGTCTACGEADPDYVAPVDEGEEPADETPADEAPVEEQTECQHNYVAAVTDPTCADAGFTTHTCELCSDSYTDSEVEALGHDYGEDHVCTVCGEKEVPLTSTAPVNEAPEKGYILTIYNADGTVGKTIDGTKSVSAFSLKTAIEDARVFVDFFGITTPATYVVEMYEDSTESESFEIGSDVTVNGNGHKIVLAEGVELTNNGTFNDVTVEEYVDPNAPVEVATFNELVAALAEEKDVVLTADITTTAAITTSGVESVIDLNGKTLTIGAGDNKFNDESNITIKNGNVVITGVTVNGNAIFCLDEYEKTLVSTLTLEDVNLTGNGYSSAYGVFYIGDSSVLNVYGGEWTLSGDTHASGGVFKADAAAATLNISGTTMTLHNVRRVVTHATTEITGSTMTITGDAGGVDAEMEHGFNRSALNISNSTITMENMLGRGITAENGDVNIVGSKITMSNVQEATIDVRNGKTLTVDDASNVEVDKAPTVRAGCTIEGQVVIKVENPVAMIGKQGYKTLEDAFAAAVDGDTITLLADATPDLTSQRAITKASVIDLGGKTLTVTEDDLYFGTTTFKNGTIVVDPSVTPSTAVFWMFANQTLTLDNVKLVATGVTGTYLIGLDGGYSSVNILNGSEILIENTSALDLDVICGHNSTGNKIVISNSKINVTNIDGRVLFGGNYTIKDGSKITLSGITKAGIRINSNETLNIEDTSVVTIDGEPRDGGIHIVDRSAVYNVASTATVNATINAPAPLINLLDASNNVVGTANDLESALAALTSEVAVIMINEDIVQTSAKNTSNYYDVESNLTITAPEGKQVTVNPCGIAIRVMGNGASLTIAENVTIENLDVFANGFGTTGENLIINGTVKALSLKQWTNNGEIVVNGNVVLGYGDGQFDMAYGNGDVIVNGNGGKSAPQFKAGYSGTRGDGNALILNDTYFEAGAWFNVNGSNGEFNLDNSILKVSGGDGAGSLTVASTGNTFKVSNGSELNVAKLTLGNGNKIVVDGTSSVKVTTLSGAGEIEIDAANLTAGATPIVGNASGFTGSISVINNDYLTASIDENGNVVIKEKEYAAKIGEKKYETLADAAAAANSGDKIVLIRDVEIASGSEVSFEGVTLTANEGVTLTVAGNLKLTDCALDSISIDGAGTTSFYDENSFDGTNSVLSGIGDTPFHLIVNKGATLLISRFTLGYNREITVNGDIADASALTAADVAAMTPALKFNSTSGVSVGGSGYGNLTVNNAYVELGNSSWKNATGTYEWSFTNSYVSATSFCGFNAPASDSASWDIVLDNSVLAAKNYIKVGEGVTQSYTNDSHATTGSMRVDGVLNIDETSAVTVTNAQNNTSGAQDEHGDISGVVNVAGELNIKGAASQYIELLGGELNVNGGTVNIDAKGLDVNADSVCVLNNGTLNSDVKVSGKLKSYANINGTIEAADGADIKIYRGTYTMDVNKWCAYGYIARDNGDGTYTVKAAVEAKIGDTAYETLGEAIAEAKPGETVILQANVVIEEEIIVDKSFELIDYKTYKITSVSDDIGFHITGENELTLKQIIIDVPVYADSNAAGAKINGQAVNGIKAYKSNLKSDGETVTVTNPDWLVKVEGKEDNYYYMSLQDAVSDAVAGDNTITLLKNCAENITVTQAPDVKITIEGSEKTMSGTITVDGKSARYATAALTIKNVNFDATNISKDASINLGGTNASRYTSNVTVKDCDFVGEGQTKVGIKQYTGGCHKLVVTGGTASGMHSLMQLKNVEQGLVITGATVTNSKNGISIGASIGAEISGCTITTTGYGIRADGHAEGSLTVENSTVSAEQPIVVRNTTAAYELTLDGNTLNVPEGGYAITVTAGDDGVEPTEPTGKFEITGNTDNLSIYPNSEYVAKVGEKSYFTLQDALKAVTSGATVEILKDITITEAWDARYTGSKFTVPVTINGNGNTIKFTGTINDGYNYLAAFRFEDDATVKNLTIDMSEAVSAFQNRFSAISAKADLTVDNCKFIGSETYTKARAIIFGEGAEVGTQEVSVTDTIFENWLYGVVDNMNGKNTASKVVIDDNAFNSASVNISAVDEITFTNNHVNGDVIITSYDKAETKLNVTATDNTLSAGNQYNVSYAVSYDKVQPEFTVVAAAKIGNTYYNTLDAAFAAAQNGDEIEIMKKGTYALNTSGKDITITGAVVGVEFANIGAKGMGGASVTFNNVTFTYAENSTYKGLQHSGDLVYNNCIFNGQVFLYGESETFNNCIFNTKDADNYNVWTYGAKEVAFNECTFNSAGKSVLIYAENASIFNDVTVTKSTFIASEAVEGKAAIEMDSSLTAGIKLTIDVETADSVSGFGTGNVSGNSLWNNKKGNKTEANNDITVVVGGETVLAPQTLVAEVAGIKYTSLVDAFAAVTTGGTITLLADVDLNNELWTPVGTKSAPFQATLDGQNHTISNLKIDDAELSYAGLIGYAKNATIKNVNIKNVDIHAYSNVAAIAGTVYTGSVDNCHVSGSIKLVADYAYAGGITSEGYVTVTNSSVIADGMGEITVKEKSMAGGITGWRGEGKNDIRDCTVKNLNITAWASVGAITGLVHYNNTIDGCTVDNVNLYKTRVDGQASIGLAAGNWSNESNDNYTITITNNSFDNITINGTAINSLRQLHGSNYSYYDKEIKLVESGNTYGNITDKLQVAAGTANALKLALTHADSGETITLLDNIELTEAVVIPEGKSYTLKQNEKTLTGTIKLSAGASLTAAEGLDVITEVADHKVVYENGTYSVVSKVYVAKIDGVKYELDEALAKWTNGKTLTLIADVTLEDVYTFPSTESRTLDLGTYTMTAAEGKNAIEIICNGQSKITYGLIVKADATNPGGITAKGKSCIYYNKSGTTKDRVIIQVDGGVFNGSYAINVYSSNRGTNCPQVSINGGIFNGNVNIGHGKLIAAGGTFNGWVNCTGDSTAYRQITGGTYKSWQFMTADASDKFFVGSDADNRENYDIGVYVDDNGYLVVGGPVITEPGTTFEASSANYGGWSSYLKYSSAKNNGVYYTSAEEALADNNKTSGKVTIHAAELDLTAINYVGTLVVPFGGELTVSFAKGNEPKVEGTNGQLLNIAESVVNGIVTRTYTALTAVASIGDVYYETLQEAIDNAKNGDVITLLANNAENVTVTQKPDVKITIDGADKTMSGTITVDGKSARYETAGLTIRNVNFDASNITKDASINLGGTNATRYTSNVTVDNCTFTGEGQTKVGIKQYTGGCHNLVVTGCTASGMHSLMQLKNVEQGLVITGATVTNSKNGISIGQSSGVVISGCTITTEGYGVRADGQGAYELTVSGSTITAEMPIVVRNASGDYKLTADNGNELNTTGKYDITFTAGDDGTYEEPTGKFVLDCAGDLKVYPVSDYVAMIGEKGYLNIDAAFAAVEDGEELKILAAGTYALNTSGKDITITGAVVGVEFANIGAKGMGGASVTFNNVTFTYAENSTYKGLQHSGDLVYNNCIFNGQVFLYGESETFNNCIFNTKDANNYNVWTYGAKKVDFNECTFNSAGKSVLIYAENASIFNDVTVTKSTFNASAAVEGKAAIEMDSSLTSGINLTIDAATTATGFGKGNVSGNSLWNNKKDNKTEANNDITVVVGGETVLAPLSLVAEVAGVKYTSLQNAVDAAKAGETVTVIASVELTETIVVAVDKAITLDLNGNTVSMKDSSGATAAMLKNNGTLTIKDTVGTGKLSFNTTTPSTSNAYASNTISNYGTLTILGGTVENTSVGGACYALDNYAGSTATISGGSLTAEKTAVRIFNWTNGVAAKAVLNIEGGSILSNDGYGINFNLGNAPVVELNVTGGTITTNDSDYNLAAYIVNKGSAENVKVNVTGGTFNGYFALNGVTCTTMGEGKMSISGGTFTGIVCYGEPAHGFVSGGVYSEPVALAWCADGYVPTENADGTYGVTEAAAVVATIGDMGFETIADAVKAAETDDTILVTVDHAVTEPVVIEKNITLDLNGKALTAESVYPVIRVQGSANVTVTGNGSITNNDYIFVLGAADGTSAGNLTIKNGTFHGATTVASVTKGVLSIEGGYFVVDPYTGEGIANYNYLLNCVDANYNSGEAQIVVKGGSFENYNPAENASEGVGKANYVPYGYTASTKNGVVWTVTKDMVASVDGVQYDSLADAIAAANGGTISVLGSIVLDEPIVIGNDVTLDLNGASISVAEGADIYPVIRVQNDANVVITGDGSITNDDYVFVLGASDGSSAGYLTIESGDFHGATTVASVTKGTLNITGGKFSVDPYEGSYTYLLNCVDANYNDKSANIVVSGGTFANFDPSNNAAEGANTNFVKDGYMVSANGDSYTVVPVPNVASVNGVEYTTVNAAVEAANDGDTVEVLVDNALTAPITVDKVITLDLNGNTVSYTSDIAGEAMITVANTGNLTVTGDGAIVYTYNGAADTAYSKGNYTINNSGTLTLESGEIMNLTAAMSHASYAINTGNGGTVNVNGGSVVNTFGYAIRQFGASTVNVTGGEVTGTRAVWMQAPGSNANNAPAIVLNVSGGTLTGTGESGYKLAVYSYSYGDSLENVEVNVSGGVIDGDIALTGGNNKTNIEKVNVTGGTLTDLYSYGDDNTASKAISITGGVFVSNYAEIYALDDGYVFVENENGSFTVETGIVVASVNGVEYFDVQSAVNAAQAGDTVKVTASHQITAPIVLDKNLTIDLGSAKIVGAADVYPVIRVQGGASLTMTGKGSITNDDYVFVLGASDGTSAGNLIVKGGSYTGATTVASVTKGTLTIEGGEFSAEMYNNSHEFLLNCIDANYKDGSAKIVVKGGTFYYFDPSNNAAEGEGTNFVADGYVAATDNNGKSYTVRELDAVAMIGDVSYETVSAALAAAKSGDVVELVANATENYVIVPNGITLNLQGYDLTANNVIVFNGGFITATYNDGKLIVAKDNLVMPEAVYNDDGRSVLPVWNNADGCYVFGRFRVMTTADDPTVNAARGLHIYEEEERIYFQFKHSATTAINQNFLYNGASDNAMNFIVRLEWETDNGIAYQEFVYNDEQVGKVTGTYDYNFTLNGYSAMNINLDTLRVYGMITTDSGAVCYGSIWTNDISK